ncbi:phage tail protein [Microbacterium sp. SS28]|uniref:phage tail protein n=1 Tax=Microbacterium sp. SS28 TaxID=2919948 RepID=UPI001FA95463|nr:phage tail protein [Microbacterium sp. SS28]
MPGTEAPAWALTVSYEVMLDKETLGAFATCEGLGVEVVLETREEGGNNAFPWQFASRLKFPNIKLTRPLSAESGKVVRWILGFADERKHSSGVITAMDSRGDPVLSWELTGVLPVRWTGPSLNAESSKVAIETLELAHHGFQVKG